MNFAGLGAARQTRAARKQTRQRERAPRVHIENTQEHCLTPSELGARAPGTWARSVHK